MPDDHIETYPAAMMHRLPILALLALLALVAPRPAITAEAEPLTMTAQRSDDGSRLGLSWQALKGAMPQVFRRRLGETGLETWQPYRPQILLPHRLLDTELKPGIAYEYQVRLQVGDQVRLGYWTAGTEVPAAPQSGHAVLVVDQTVETALAAPLDRLTLDLVGDGWRVTRMAAPRASDRPEENMNRAIALRQRISDALTSDPFADRAVLLIGHLPVVRSGWINPDGHDRQPQASDLFYVTPDAFWPPVVTPKDQLALRPTVIPGGHIAAPIGRVDFSDLSAAFGAEADLLAAWLDRNHRWRQAEDAPLTRAYAQNGNLLLERAELLNVVGSDALIEAGHHNHQGKGAFLFGVDFGDYRGAAYAELPPVEAIFTINFGSHKQQFNSENNAMRALLAASDMALTCAWGGRPSWLMHGMALNETIGQAQMRTVNNGDVTKGGLETREYGLTGNYDWINPVWVNLIGDPTLRPFPQPPATDFIAIREGGSVRLVWTLPDDAQSAVLYRAERREGPYDVIGKDLSEGGFTDPEAPPGAWYMLRAKGLAQLHAGSFYRLSAGKFASAP